MKREFIKPVVEEGKEEESAYARCRNSTRDGDEISRCQTRKNEICLLNIAESRHYFRVSIIKR